MDTKDELNITRTSSEDETSKNETETPSINIESEEILVKPSFTSEEKINWFKDVIIPNRPNDEVFDVPVSKRKMNYPFIAWEYDNNRQIFILMRRRGHYHIVLDMKQFKSLPR